MVSVYDLPPIKRKRVMQSTLKINCGKGVEAGRNLRESAGRYDRRNDIIIKNQNIIAGEYSPLGEPAVRPERGDTIKNNNPKELKDVRKR